MATSAERELKILLSLVAGDLSGAQKVRAEMAAIEADQARLVKQLQEQSDVSPAVGRRIDALKQEISQQAVINAQMERRVIVETEIEAAEARIAGNPALAVRLEREAAIRARALGIQRALNVSVEESIVLAEKLVLAQEAGVAPTAMAGVNLAKAKTEAMVLTRELAAGNVRASTLSSLLGSMGTAFTISGLAAYEIYHLLSSSADESLRLSNEARKNTEELVKQLTHWNELAQAASDFGDVIKFGEQLQPALDAAAAKLEEFRNKELSAFKLLWDAIGSIGQLTPGNDPNSFAAERDKDTARQESALQNLIRNAVALKGTAQQAADAWQSLKLEPLDVAIEKQNALVEKAREKYAALKTELRDLAVGNLDEEKTQRALQALKALDEAGRKLELETKRSDELTKSQSKLAAETDKVSAAINKMDFGDLDSGHQLEALSTDLEGIRGKLLELGVDAASPNDALEKSKQLTAETREEVIKLAAAWAQVLGLILKVEQSEEEEARKRSQQETNAMLREQAALIERVRQQQRLIGANTFLSPDAKQALSLASMTAEMLALSAAIEQTKAKMAGGPLDPVLHERLQAQLQKDQFEFDLLKLKIAAINKPLAAELADWVNNFGTSAHQIAGIIENSINATLQSTNQLLIDSAFRTGDWRQTLVGLEKQLLQFFLTWMEQQALQLIFGETAKQTSTASSIAQGAAVAAAHAPAAAATSISSYGTAAVVGEALAVAAIIAIMAALGGGFKKGGYTGDGSPDDFAGPAHKGEFYFSAEETRNIGLDRLYAAQHFGRGGRVRNISGDGEFNPLLPHWSGGPIEPSILNQTGRGNFVPDDGRLDAWTLGSGATETYTPRGGGYIHPGDDDPFQTGARSIPRWDVPTRSEFAAWKEKYAPNDSGSDYDFYSAWLAGALPDENGHWPDTFKLPNHPTFSDESQYANQFPTLAGHWEGNTFFPHGSWADINRGNMSPGSNLFMGLGWADINRGNISAPLDSTRGNVAAGSVLSGPEATLGASWNSTRGQWESYNPATGGWDKVSGFGSGTAGYDPTGALGSLLAQLPPGSTVVGRDAVTGAPVIQDPSGRLYVPPGTGVPQRDTSVRDAVSRFSGSPDMMDYGHGMNDRARDLGVTELEWSGHNLFGLPNLPRFMPRQGQGPEFPNALDPNFSAKMSAYSAWLAAQSTAWDLAHAPHGANGMRIPGPPSKSDTVPAWLSTGEQVIDAHTTAMLDRTFGRDWVHQLASMQIPIERPRFAAGGRVGGQSSAGGSERSAGAGRMKLVIVSDLKAAIREAQSEPEYHATIVNAVNGARHELGLPATQ